MTDLDEFKALFKSKGVPHEELFNELCVSCLMFSFDKDGKFVGVHDYEEDVFAERIPTPETP